MWLYKVCKMHDNKKTYTVTGIYEDKKDAENAKKRHEFFDHFTHKFKIKRFSGESYEIF